jgi:glycosyltransferase involved in cell wall biosynthesis
MTSYNNKISIIIPCYNDGVFLRETISELYKYQGEIQFEVIVVNDGSTDTFTIQELNQLQSEFKFKLINQENKRMSAARNAGIKVSTAEYFIALDADDILNWSFVEKAYETITLNIEIGVVYGNCEYFGEKTGIDNKNFDPISQLYVNGINITALVRKKTWEQCEGFDENMLEGYEDWEFWVHILEKGWLFKKIDMVAFKYRIKKQSTNTRAIDKHEVLMQYIQKKHIDLYNQQYISINRAYNDLKNNRRLLLQYLINNLLGRKN